MSRVPASQFPAAGTRRRLIASTDRPAAGGLDPARRSNLQDDGPRIDKSRIDDFQSFSLPTDFPGKGRTTIGKLTQTLLDPSHRNGDLDRNEAIRPD